MGPIKYGSDVGQLVEHNVEHVEQIAKRAYIMKWEKGS